MKSCQHYTTTLNAANSTSVSPSIFVNSLFRFHNLKVVAVLFESMLKIFSDYPDNFVVGARCHETLYEGTLGSNSQYRELRRGHVSN